MQWIFDKVIVFIFLPWFKYNRNIVICQLEAVISIRIKETGRTIKVVNVQVIQWLCFHDHPNCRLNVREAVISRISICKRCSYYWSICQAITICIPI
ncbi:hypothetical protein DRQ53_10015 [bacterium]|nr:MAG: hypothetical protein DRQ53_10015 [bacterium]